MQCWVGRALEAHMTGLTAVTAVTVPIHVRTQHPGETASPSLSASTSLFLAAIVLSPRLLCHWESVSVFFMLTSQSLWCPLELEQLWPL